MVKKSRRNPGFSPLHLLYMLISFLFGCMLCSTVLVHTHISQTNNANMAPAPMANMPSRMDVTRNKGLQGLRVLVALASFDFAQFPLLEEVLDSYQDVCVAGAKIDLYIHTVLPYTGKKIVIDNSASEMT
jgi:hypothetical protein